ncbi:phosphotransferase family protein [Microlunatus speluncae]|uniref:phosphotransferase family protein n=1 Tax=Microlunatus speluncae TaxID=2594267 RepID=UPI0012666B74|nr:phosphotransferase family protein [Microlunatus speluncae]
MIDDGVRAWLTEDALPGRRIDEVRRLAGGFSNDTLLVRSGDDRYVLRRYLRGNTSAVEVALARRLAGVVPVPEIVAADTEGATAGAPVVLSRFVAGTLGSELLARSSLAEARLIGIAVGEVLARIGSVAFAAPGFFTGPELEPGPPGMEPASGLAAFVDNCLARGNVESALSEAEVDGLRGLAADWEPRLAAVHGASRLVHSDFNPKNLLAARVGDDWRVTAVLDWEFAFSGSPLVDIGNMLRFPDETGGPYADGFVAGYAAHADLPDDWRELSLALDLYALAEFLTRPTDHPFFARAIAVIRGHLTAR